MPGDLNLASDFGQWLSPFWQKEKNITSYPKYGYLSSLDKIKYSIAFRTEENKSC